MGTLLNTDRNTILNGMGLTKFTLKNNYDPQRRSERKKITSAVADSGEVRGVQMHPPLAASNVFLRT